ncbi:acyl-CoA dehydrogenase family protein [Cryptosporangium phraense]|uniref:Acyl-CoA dehydrogenase n=1 Tax=Cryptosporangium phraense TaxID=2593070 RepID=A0A545B0K4_9ACTN|nr:acyl-CoA dehydrogenase family protein [Cryptosporangium phraense]TQS47099.1 acyl-CoA dehydrogenase [Cryptosporangium phraense]
MDFTPDPSLHEAAELTALVIGRAPASELWAALVDAGLVEIALPADVRGDDLGPAGAAAVLTELGRAAAATPALATLMLGALPLARAGHLEPLPRVIDDHAVLTAALHEPSSAFPSLPRATAVRSAGGFTVAGVKVGVPDAEAAERVLVPVTLSGSPGLLAVDPRTPGVSIMRTPGAGPAAPYRVSFDEVSVPASALVGDAAAVDDLYRLAVAGAASYADGLLAGALALTVAHVGAREQFGRPLATFQAVAQEVAEVYLASRTLHLLAQSAIWQLSRPDPATDGEIAAYWVATELPRAIGRCHHLHGGLGLDRDYPLHRYSAAASDLARLVGGPENTLDRLGGQYVCSSN